MSLRYLFGMIGLYVSLLVTLIACEAERAYDGLRTTTSTYSGNIIVTTVATDPATGPGIATMFDSSGTVISVLRDLYPSSEFATGVGYLGSNELVYGVEGTDRLEILNLATSAVRSITHAQLTSTPVRHVAISSGGEILISEANVNTVEKFAADGSRAGNPFIATTVGSCSLSSPWGIAVLPSGNVAVVSAPAAAGRLSVYDSTGGSCVAHVTAAPFNAGTPTAIAYHAPSDRLLVTFATTHAIFAVDTVGGNSSQIYLNSGVINTPRAIATDSEGNIYVGSSGTDTVEKLSWSGSGSATRVGGSPLIGPGLYSQNPTGIVIIP